MSALRWRDEEGSLTLWMLGLAVLVLGIGGISVDLWRAHAVRRELAAVADAAAFAGASGIDVAAFRRTGEVSLRPDLAERLATADLAGAATTVDGVRWVVGASTTVVEVVGEADVDLTLLGLLAPTHDPVPVRVTAAAAPRLVP